MLWYAHTKRVRVMRSFNSVCISLEIVMICWTAMLEKNAVLMSFAVVGWRFVEIHVQHKI